MAIVIDAANVVGSRPDGWWRDRAGAADRLLRQLAAALRAGTLTGPVVVVLEGAARGAPEPVEWVRAQPGEPAERQVGPPGVSAPGEPASSPPAEPAPRVVRAPGDGDSTIVAEVARLVTEGAEPAVVTADRGLRARVLAAGGTVLPPSWLLDRLPR